MYVVVMKSKLTNEIFAVLRTVSKEVRKFQDYATAERTAFEENAHIVNQEFIWVAKVDDGIYFTADDGDVDD